MKPSKYSSPFIQIFLDLGLLFLVAILLIFNCLYGLSKVSKYPKKTIYKVNIFLFLPIIILMLLLNSIISKIHDSRYSAYGEAHLTESQEQELNKKLHR